MHAAVRHTASFVLPAPVDVVFPLFSPEGERLWAPGWEYENVMGTTDLAEDYIFLTDTHDHASGRAVWIVKRFEPLRHRVEFYKVEPGDKVGIVEVRCRAVGDDTEVEITYTYRALSERGRAFVDAFSTDAYAALMAEWEDQLRGFLDP